MKSRAEETMEELPALWTSYRKRKHFALLDGLRCISILAVVWHHTAAEEVEWGHFFKKGFLGVDLFFVISGFLIVTLILREKERAGSFSIRNFAIRRTLRIFPPYYFTLLLLALYFATLGGEGESASSYFRELPFLATYTSNWVEVTTFMSIAWSLSTEEQFYLFWPPIERFFSRLVPLILPLLLLVNIALQYRLFDLEALFGVKYSDLEILQVTFTPILLGVLLAHLLHREECFMRLAKLVKYRGAALFFLLAISLVAAFNGDLSGTPRLFIHLMAALLIACCVVNEKNWLAPLFTNRWVERIGIVSYGMYLYHMIVRHFVDAAADRLPFHGHPIIYFAVVAFFTYLFSELSYRSFESKFLLLKEHFIRSPSVAQEKEL